jgi:hypothetical protein
VLKKGGDEPSKIKPYHSHKYQSLYKKGDNNMRLLKLWKVGAIAASVGVIALVSAACAGETTVTATPPPKTVTVTATQTVARTLIVDANTVIGAEGVLNPQDICVVSSRFPQGETVVWQIKVYDPATGQLMDDTVLNSVVVKLSDGQTFDARYGPHPGAPPDQPQPPATDHFWTTAWSIPATYPTGSAPFTVTATSKDGRTGTFSEFNVVPALLTVVAAP